MTVAVRLPEDMEQRLTLLSERTGRKKSFYLKEALMNYMEDMEDIYLAEKALEDIRSGRSKTIPFDELETQINVVD